MRNSRHFDFNMKDYVFIILIAIELLMSFTFLGYIHIPPISITFAYIPVIAAACFLGVKQSICISFIFALASMYKATAYYVLPFDKIFSPFFSGYPLRSIILNIGMRTLFGLISGLLFQLAARQKYKRTLTGILAVLAPKFHAFLIYLAMGILFPQYGYSFTKTFSFSINDLIAMLLCLVVIELLWVIAETNFIKNFSKYVRYSNSINTNQEKIFSGFSIFLIFTLFIALISSFYFARRMAYMLDVHGLVLTEQADYDLFHLQIQFVIAAFSLNFIIAVAFVIIYKYISYNEYLNKLDGLTGVMGRKMFLQYCDTIQDKYSSGLRDNYFIIFDIDYFKLINDTYGHPTGDKVLVGIADNLKKFFSNIGKAGRIGGDEFAVVIEEYISDDELKRTLDNFLSSIAGLIDDTKVTCSIGACRFDASSNIDDVYKAADKLLYTTKENGKAGYTIGNYKE